MRISQPTTVPLLLLLLLQFLYNFWFEQLHLQRREGNACSQTNCANFLNIPSSWYMKAFSIAIEYKTVKKQNTDTYCEEKTRTLKLILLGSIEKSISAVVPCLTCFTSNQRSREKSELVGFFYSKEQHGHKLEERRKGAVNSNKRIENVTNSASD